MYYYFTSPSSRAIFLSGAYLGTCGLEPKKCDIISSNTLLEAVSVDNANDSYRLVLTEKTLESPPSGVVVTDLKGGYLLHFKDKPNLNDFKVLAQEKYSDVIVTVFYDNGLRLSVETERDFYATTIFEVATRAEIKRLNDKRLVLVSLTLKTGVCVMILSINDKIKKLYSRRVSSFSLGEDLVTTECLKDVKKHVITTTLDYDGEKIYVKDRALTHKKDMKSVNVIPELLPYLFLEDFLVGDDVSSYLSCDILEKIDSLKQYLKDYSAIITPPAFRNSNEIGLVYKKAENKYLVEYFTFTVENDKIVNLKKLDE